MSAALSAARACARTILWQSLRLDALCGATPHILLVVDAVPCTLQKILLEGYLQELDAINSRPPPPALGENTHAIAAALRVGIEPLSQTPCYTVGLRETCKVTYGVLPFHADTFLREVRSLQALLRQCGGGGTNGESQTEETEKASSPQWGDEKWTQMFHTIAPLLAPDGAEDASWRATLPHALRHGPQRELLGCILFQRNAFQNELDKYRLRLDLFAMGLRVAEHCHLEIMSRHADARAAHSDSQVACCALEEDEGISYMRSCAFPPHVAEAMGHAIADAIDAWSWSRVRKDDGAALAVTRPHSFEDAVTSDALSSVYNAGALGWTNAEATSATEEERNGSVIAGPGAPLRVVCRDGQTLCYDGGMEDCLLNTGFYAAAEAAARNEVISHRERFPITYGTDPTEDPTDAAPSTHTPPETDAVLAAPPKGRLKKKEYLALRKEANAAKRQTRRSSSPSAHAEEDGVTRSGACVGSSIGGTFPVGEVISESFDLSKLNGTCAIFAYPNLFKEVTMTQPRPLTMRVEKGIVTELSPDTPAELVELIDLVRQVEGACYVRELGIGLNPFVGRQHVVSDVTSFERQFGVHLSLGQRHPLFVKQSARRNADGSVAAGVSVEGPVLKRKAGKYHIDVFVDAERLEMGSFVLDFTKGLAYQ